MDADAYLAALAIDGEKFAEAAAGNLDRPVPACPEWDVAALVDHLGRTHASVARVVAAAGEQIDRNAVQPHAGSTDTLIAWYRDGLTRVIAALSVDPETPAWTYLASAPNTVAYWQQRQALETVIHRWDVQKAAGSDPDPIDASLAVAGIDELVTSFLPVVLAARPVDALTGTLHLHCTDVDGEWWLDFDAEGLAPRREHAKGDTAIRAPASNLYLWMWNRITADAAGLQIFGNPETVTNWGLIAI
jgi:uncharacterized protein (TIGR03083 family)